MAYSSKGEMTLFEIQTRDMYSNPYEDLMQDRHLPLGKKAKEND